jgi:hypothetical protein
VPHYDYVYSYVDLKVPHDLSDDLAKSSESILIDHLKNEVGARCASLSANAVTIQYVIDVVEGNVKPSRLEYEKRIKSMKKMFADGKRFELDWWPDVTGDTDPKNKYYKESKKNTNNNVLIEAEGLGLTIFDIDDTLFRTTAQIKVVKDGKIVRSLNNQEFNTYQLKPGESFDFGEFQNAEKFNKESIPIEPMIAKLKAIINNAGDSKIIMLTARSDFDNKDLFLDTFRKYGIDMNKVHVHRAGNLGGSPSQNKAVWIRKYLDTGKYARVRLYDDAMSNIKMFIGLQQEYPSIKFFPYFVTHEGTIKTIREDGRIVKGVNTTVDVGPNEIKTQAAKFGNTVDRDGRPPTMSKKTKGSSTNVLFNLGMVKEDTQPRYTAAEWAIIEGGHTFEEPVVKPKKPGRLFAALTEAFDTEVEWIKDFDDGDVKVFATKVDDAYIELTYKKMTNGDVYIAFSRGGSIKVTGEGSQNKIFGAVINHIQRFVAEDKPKRVIFSAFKPNTGAFGAQDTTRSSLYRRMVQRFASQNGYAYDVEDTGNEDTFILTRQNVEENFADGKKPGRKGLAKRSGVNTKASVSSLRKTAKSSSGEKQRMAHWLANMKAGRAKKK